MFLDLNTEKEGLTAYPRFYTTMTHEQNSWPANGPSLVCSIYPNAGRPRVAHGMDGPSLGGESLGRCLPDNGMVEDKALFLRHGINKGTGPKGRKVCS